MLTLRFMMWFEVAQAEILFPYLPHQFVRPKSCAGFCATASLPNDERFLILITKYRWRILQPLISLATVTTNRLSVLHKCFRAKRYLSAASEDKCRPAKSLEGPSVDPRQQIKSYDLWQKKL